MGLGRGLILSGLLFFTAYVWLHLSMAWCQGGPLRALPATAIAALIFLLGWGLALLGHFLPLSLGSRNTLFLVCATFMVFELWFGTAMLLCDAINVVLRLVRHLAHGGAAAPPFPWRMEALAGVALVLVASIVGFLQTGRPNVRVVSIADARIPAEADGYRIMLCSDLHLITPYRSAILDKVEAAAAEWRPSLFLHAGDFIDGPRSGDLTALCDRLAAWSFPDGKYGSFGNHDGYADWQVSRQWHERAGIALLGNRMGRPEASPLPWLHLTAIDDQAVWIENYHKGLDPAAETEAIALCEKVPAPPEETFNILLRHRPDLRKDGCPGWQLMLSGHTHGGQLFPFSLSIPLTYPYRTGRLHTLENGLRLYICQGTGFWGPPFRFLVPPEITIVELHHAS